MQTTNKNKDQELDEFAAELRKAIGPAALREMSPIERHLRRGERIDRLYAEIDGLIAQVVALRLENAKLRAKRTG